MPKLTRTEVCAGEERRTRTQGGRARRAGQTCGKCANYEQGRFLPYLCAVHLHRTNGQQANDAASSAAWTFDLAKQRGEMVNSLEQGLSNLERGASDWMKSAREQMIKQAAKDKISKFF